MSRQGLFCLSLVAAMLAPGPIGCRSAPPRGRTGSGVIPILDPNAASAAGLSAPEASQALQLYTAKCVRCHQSYNPAAYGEAQWRSWMTKMSKKAKLTSEQDKLLSRYLAAYRAAADSAGKTANSHATH